MICRPINALSLKEYYNKLCQIQAKRHGDDYLLVHDEIRGRLKKCKDYVEFGVRQGTTLAAAILEHPKKVTAYDINLEWYNKAKELFETYTSSHEIKYSIYEANTLDITIPMVDLLYIDSTHMYKHLVKELNFHGNNVKKYIICHDTFSRPNLKKAIVEYIKDNKEWHIVTECTINVGFITIEKKKG